MGLWDWITNWAGNSNQDPPWIMSIKHDLKRRQKQIGSHLPLEKLDDRDQQLIAQIQQKTRENNRNNVTRTKAYLDAYLRSPELHWSLLAHMVSRNAGWNMTDLKGELLPRLLSEKDRNELFFFLERANWLIFQDAFPQLLLYEESIKRGKPLFYLLPYFQVSIFMESIWHIFWMERNHYILTAGLVVNEQNYIEQRVMQLPFFQQTVLNSLEFKLQDVLHLNQILFPSLTVNTAQPFLFGLTVEHFTSLANRIVIGKKLYHLLFRRSRLEEFCQWAKQQPHTGSRKDYWPKLFGAIQDSPPGEPYRNRLTDCKLKKGAKRFYSPILTQSWREVDHHPAEQGDWYRDWSILRALMDEEVEEDGNVQSAYCHTLEKVELAIISHEAIISP